MTGSGLPTNREVASVVTHRFGRLDVTRPGALLVALPADLAERLGSCALHVARENIRVMNLAKRPRKEEEEDEVQMDRLLGPEDCSPVRRFRGGIGLVPALQGGTSMMVLLYT